MKELRRCAHNPAHECASCYDARHAIEHPALVDGCLTCKLSTIRIYGRFTGAQSLNGSVEAFWASGDPGFLDGQEYAVKQARKDRRTRIG